MKDIVRFPPIITKSLLTCLLQINDIYRVLVGLVRFQLQFSCRLIQNTVF